MQIYKNSPNFTIWGASFANFSVFRNAVLNDMYKYKKIPSIFTNKRESISENINNKKNICLTKTKSGRLN